jgi:hypothetical protein
MGNDIHKTKPSGSPLKSFIPPGKTPRSKVLNDMMNRAVRKFDENIRLATDDVFVPKTIYYDDESKTQDPKNGKEKYESTQPLYGLSSDPQRFDAGSLENIDSNSGVATKTPSQNSIATVRNEKLPIKQNSSRGITGKYANQLSSQRGKDNKSGNKYFVSQNKLKATASKQNLSSKTSLTSHGSKKKLTVKPIQTSTTANDKQASKLKGIISPSNVQDDEYEGANIGENLEKLPPKKKFVINCSLEKKLFNLPDEVQFLIFSYLLEDYHRLILISPIWYYKITESFDIAMINLDNKFIQHHMNILAFKRSYYSVMPYTSNKRKAIRMDRNVIAEVLPCLAGTISVLDLKF